MTIWRMRITCYKNTFSIWSTYCFPTTAVVARTRLVTRVSPVWFLFNQVFESNLPSSKKGKGNMIPFQARCGPEGG